MNENNFQLKISEARKKIHKKRFNLFKICLGNDVRIFSEPKTGSTTMQYLVNSPWHMHYHSFRSLKYLFSMNRHNRSFSWTFLVTSFFAFCIKVKAKIFRKEVKIISTIRNPADRIASSFFFNFEYHFLKFRNSHPKAITNDLFSHEEITEYIFDEFVDRWVNVYSFFDYFDSEIKRLTGIDVYKSDFDKQKGFSIYKQGCFSLMIVDCYKIKELKNEIEDFVGYQIDPMLTEMNSSNKKWYRELYKRIYNQSKRREIEKKLSKSKYIQHFYNEN